MKGAKKMLDNAGGGVNSLIDGPLSDMSTNELEELLSDLKKSNVPKKERSKAKKPVRKKALAEEAMKLLAGLSAKTGEPQNEGEDS